MVGALAPAQITEYGATLDDAGPVQIAAPGAFPGWSPRILCPADERSVCGPTRISTSWIWTRVLARIADTTPARIGRDLARQATWPDVSLLTIASALDRHLGGMPQVNIAAR
jgi:hypothetical protein